MRFVVVRDMTDKGPWYVVDLELRRVVRRFYGPDGEQRATADAARREAERLKKADTLPFVESR